MITGENYTVHIGNNLDILPTLPDNSVDSIVTDPPYGLSDNSYVAETITRWIQGERDFIPDSKGFMGKSWDAFVPPPALWDECLRVLKPGGHLLAFFGSRTQDIGALAIRLAGFEVRDSIAWMYGSGFPKSLDVSKAIDKAAGAERERTPYKGGIASGQGNYGGGGQIHDGTKVGNEAITPEAKQWEGWGTALKPAFEPIVVARKPLGGKTVAENVLTYGTGGLNIDGSRVKGESWSRPPQSGVPHEGNWKPIESESNPAGRWPANVILDEYTAGLLDEQSGIRPGGTFPAKRGQAVNTSFASGQETVGGQRSMGDTGGASRFFYCAKASKRDRNEGLDELPKQMARKFAQDETTLATMPFGKEPVQNFHPTVKPTALMKYLINLVTPPGGTVLDPFTGSGSTGKAAILEGFRFVGIELTEDYIPIIEGRLKHIETVAKEDEGLF